MGRASEKRLARVTSLLMHTLSEIIHAELADPRLALCSITEIRLARDLTTAEVKVSTVSGQQATEDCAAALNGASGLIWNRLRGYTDLRVIPKLRFSADHSGEYLDEIEQLLRTIPAPAMEDGVEQPVDGSEPEPPAGETTERMDDENVVSDHTVRPPAGHEEQP